MNGLDLESASIADLVADFYAAAGDYEPAQLYRRLREEDPVHRSVFGFWVVSRYEHAESLLKGALTARTAPPLSHEGSPLSQLNRFFLTRLDPPDHGRLRSLVRKAFSPTGVKQHTESIRTATVDLVRLARDRGTVDIATELAGPLPASIFNELFAVPLDDRPELASWLAALSLGSPPVGAPPWAKDIAEDSAAALTQYLIELIDARRRQPGPDMLSAILVARDEGAPVSDEELVSVVAQLLQAGTQTTEVLLTQGVLTLWQHPEQLQLLRSEPHLVGSAVDECLRYSSPIRTMAQRRAVQDIDLDGVRIAAGDELTIWVGAANRDPAVFDHPDEFIITRSPNPHLGFSTGAHFCLGAHLARLEANVVLATLVAELPDFRVVEDAVTYGDSALRPKITSLPVVCR